MKYFITGDFFFDDKNQLEEFKVIKQYFEKESYLSLINFEGCFKSESFVRKSVNLFMNKEALNILPSNSILLLNNNHITDSFASGVKNTIFEIKKKFKCSGLNSKYNDIQSYISIDDKIFVGTMGWKNEDCITKSNKEYFCNNFNEESIDRLYKISKSYNSDYKILSVHAGYEYERFPLPLHVGLSRYAIDIGFDLVYFNHSHNIQEYEFYKGKLIHYGLGNFFFGSRRNKFPELCDNGKILILDFSGNLKISYMNILYDRIKKKSFIYNNKKLFKLDKTLGDLNIYSKNYYKIRTRKKNPRPILYYNKKITNTLKYLSWKIIVEIFGILRLRKFVKRLLGWNSI